MKLRKNVTEFGLVFLNQFITGFSSIILLKILSHQLTPSLYGDYALIMSVIAFILGMPFNSITQGVIRCIPLYHGTQQQYLEFVLSCVGLCLAVLAGYFIILFVVYFFVQNVIWMHAYWMAYLCLCSQVICLLTQCLYNGNRRRGKATVIAFASLILNVIFLLVFFKNIGDNTLMLVFGLLTISNFLAAIITIGKDGLLVFRTPWHCSMKYITPVWRFSYPLILTASFVWIRTMASRWYLVWFVDKPSVAAFAILSTLAMMCPLALQGLLGAYVAPILYKNYQENPAEARIFLRNAILILCTIGGLSLIVVYVFSSFIVVLFSSTYYVQYAWMLAPMYLAFFVYIIAATCTFTLFAQNKTKILVVPSILADIMVLLSGLWMTMEWGLMGAFWNFILGYLVMALVLFWLSLKNW